MNPEVFGILFAVTFCDLKTIDYRSLFLLYFSLLIPIKNNKFATNQYNEKNYSFSDNRFGNSVLHHPKNYKNHGFTKRMETHHQYL